MKESVSNQNNSIRFRLGSTSEVIQRLSSEVLRCTPRHDGVEQARKRRTMRRITASGR